MTPPPTIGSTSTEASSRIDPTTITRPDLRDYLYTKMRGAKGEVNLASGSGNDGALDATEPEDQTLNLLREIRDALRRLAEGQSKA